MDVFVGRDDELVRLAGAPVVLISGEPGIGKTRLADELASRAGGHVVWGRAWEGEGTPAYWPWLEVLRALAGDSRTAAAIEQACLASEELAALLAMRPLGDARARFRLLDGIAGALRAAAPVTVVLDDLHAADAASLELLAFVARAVRGTPVRVIATTRDASFVARADAAALLAKFAREATSVPLRRLSRAEVAQWIELAAPGLRDRADRLFENSDGNPLFVAELIVAWQRNVPAAPLAIGDAIRAHLALVSPAGLRALEQAAVLGRDLSRAALRALGVGGAAIDEALATGVLHASGDEHLRFSHVLVRDELYTQLPHARRAELHAAAARTFARDPEQAVRHVLAAPDAFAQAEAIATVIAAMRAAIGRLAYADVAALGARAVALALEPALESALRTAIGEALILGGDAERGRAECMRAADLATDGTLLARAALAHATESRLGRHEATVALLRRAVAAEPEDAALRIQLLARLAASLIPATPEEGDEPLRLAREAVSRARELGDEATIVATHTAMLATFPHEFAISERHALGGEVIAIARRTGQLARVAGVPGWQIACWIELGQLAAAREELRAAEALIATLPSHHAWRIELLHGLFAALDGDFERARTIARAAIAKYPGEGAHMAAIQLMAMPYLHGDASVFAPDDPVVSRTLGALPGHALFHSIADALMGRVDRVRAAIEHARTLDLTAVPGASSLGWPLVVAELADHAAELYTVAAAAASRGAILFTPNALMTTGCIDVLAARLAHLAGRSELVPAHLARARAFAERLGAAGVMLQVEHAERDLGTPAAPGTLDTPTLSLGRRGELWALGAGGRELLLEHRLGLEYLATLVAAPHRDVHVLELVGAEEDGDAGPLLDERARRAYRERADDLRDQLAEAEARADLGRVERARAELEALASELVRATGLGGRERRAGSTAERARINVQRRLRDVIRRVADQDAALGRHLELSLKTGAFCRYAPTWERSFHGRERR